MAAKQQKSTGTDTEGTGSVREEAVYYGRGTCDGDRYWIYNISNWRILRAEMRRDRCSALMSSRCTDMGERLHENHILPEGYLLAESTLPAAVSPGCVKRIVWADSETGEGTTVGVQMLEGRDRHRLIWCDEDLELRERRYAGTEEGRWLLSDTEAEFLLGSGRYVHSRMPAEDVRRDMLDWLRRKYLDQSESDLWEARCILAAAGQDLARRHIISGGDENQSMGADAVLLVELATGGETDAVSQRISDAAETTELFADDPFPMTADHAIAREIWENYGRWANPLKKFRTSPGTSHGN